MKEGKKQPSKKLKDIICSWCKEKIGESEAGGHGICEKCEKKIRKKGGI